MSAISGHLARVTIDGNILRAYRWSVDWRVDCHDATSFEVFAPTASGQPVRGGIPGLGIYEMGVTDVDISLDCFWDTAENPFVNPRALAPGTYHEVFIYFDKVTAPASPIPVTNAYWDFRNVLVTSVRNEGAVRDLIRMAVTFRVSGDTLARAAIFPPVGT